MDTIDHLLTGQTPTLSRAEEHHLFTRLRQLEAELAELREVPRPWDAAHGGRLGARMREEARIIDRLTTSNLGLIASTVSRWTKGRDPDEFVAEGSIVLMRCIRKFDPECGYRFSTYTCGSMVRAYSSIQRKRDRHHQYHMGELDDEMPEELGDMLPAEVVDAIESLLTPNEGWVIRLRYAVAGAHEVHSLKRTAEMMGIGVDDVKELQASALDKLRQGL